jgi:hypothetical protein
MTRNQINLELARQPSPSLPQRSILQMKMAVTRRRKLRRPPLAGARKPLRKSFQRSAPFPSRNCLYETFHKAIIEDSDVEMDSPSAVHPPNSSVVAKDLKPETKAPKPKSDSSKVSNAKVAEEKDIPGSSKMAKKTSGDVSSRTLSSMLDNSCS